MKLCCNMSFPLRKQSQRSRSVSLDGSRFFGLFRKEKPLPNNRISTVYCNVFLSVLDRKKTFVFVVGFILEKTAFQIVIVDRKKLSLFGPLL